MSGGKPRVEERFSAETSGLRQFLTQRPTRLREGGGSPRISVVIPSFNQVDFIERTLLSVFNQDYQDVEIIVIDGGSGDGTLEVLERHRDRLAYVHSGPDMGQSDALNHGFSKATGDIFAWMNSDDLYLPGAFGAIVEEFAMRPDASVVFGDWWSIDSEDNVTDFNYAFDFNLNHFVYEGFHLNSQAMFWRRDAHRHFGSFDVNLHRTMDYDLILRLGLGEGQDRFARIQRALACFRRHPQQKTTGSGLDIVAAEHRLIAEKNGFAHKYTLAGRVLRLVYRIRRIWWYLKRGGVGLVWRQIVRIP